MQINPKMSLIHNKQWFKLSKEDLNKKGTDLAGEGGKLLKVRKEETEDKVKTKQKQEEKIDQEMKSEEIADLHQNQKLPGVMQARVMPKLSLQMMFKLSHFLLNNKKFEQDKTVKTGNVTLPIQDKSQ